MRLIELDTVDSTNTWIKTNRKTLQNGDAVTALSQTAGRGRIGHTWLDSEGMLPISVLLRDPPYPGVITLSVSLAVCEVLCSLSDMPISIKWPNDILLDGYKLCGILCERAANGDSIDIICGVGLNLSQSEEYFKEAGIPHGGSIKQLTGIAPDRISVAAALQEKITEYSTRDFKSLREEYKRRCATLGKEVRLIEGGRECLAFAEDIAENGYLICRDDNGTFEVNSGEVSVRGLYGYV